jgi:ATP-dependent DNA helicase RecQ
MPAGPCGGCDVCVPELARITAPAATSSAQKKASAVSAFGDGDEELFEKLRTLRKSLADARKVPAYIIFGDRSLKDMAARRPADRSSFTQVFGVGAAKVESFADIFLKAIREYEGRG